MRFSSSTTLHLWALTTRSLPTLILVIPTPFSLSISLLISFFFGTITFPSISSWPLILFLTSSLNTRSTPRTWRPVSRFPSSRALPFLDSLRISLVRLADLSVRLDVDPALGTRTSRLGEERVRLTGVLDLDFDFDFDLDHDRDGDGDSERELARLQDESERESDRESENEPDPERLLKSLLSLYLRLDFSRVR